MTSCSSIVVHDCDYRRLLGDAIDHARAHQYLDIEVMVVDDGSLVAWSSGAFGPRFAA